MLDYTVANFGVKQLSIITDKIDKTVTRLQLFPLSAVKVEAIKGKNVRVVVVVSTLKILYEVKDNTLHILFVWNSNMDLGTVLNKISQ